jgi:hypothetical protein
MNLLMVKSILVIRKKYLFLTISLLFYFSCSNIEKKEAVKYFYVITSGASELRKKDTIEINKFSFHFKNDSLFNIYSFELDGVNHELRHFSNMNNNSVDGGHFCYELDNLGVIFSSSFTFENKKRLISSNDSINRIICFGLSEALFHSEEGYYYLFVQNIKPKVINIPLLLPRKTATPSKSLKQDLR